MNRGRKPDLPSVKEARGTFRKDRDGDKVSYLTPGDPPLMPDYLTPEAADVWQEELGRAMTGGAEELDSSEFAAYCSLEASIRAAFREGACPPVTALAEARKKRELFGLAGPKTRIARGDKKSKNFYATL